MTALLPDYSAATDFHNAGLVAATSPTWRYAWVNRFTYTFNTFFHPFVGDMLSKLNQSSLQAMLNPAFLSTLQRTYLGTYYNAVGTSYNMAASVSMPPATIDTSIGGAYSVYNWELFYHIPVMIAVHLSQNQRFAEAQSWFHLVFDPTFTDAGSSPSYPFWKFIGFRQPNLMENLVEILSYSGSDPTQLALKQSVMLGYSQIMTTPFDAHAVARMRPMAYMYYVVMKYLDNLIGWGDFLFGGGKPADMQGPTIETINEATLCYVLAANLLGPRPQQLTPRGTASARSYSQLQAAGMDAMGNALVDLEVQFPFNTSTTSGSGNGSGSGPLFGVAQTLYFCIPPNRTLLAYWDTVEDRLFKIRNCENLQGQVIQLPLFDPPIDPGMLVKAAAAGIDVGSIVSGLNQPIGPVRSLPLIQKALELANEVRNFGASLLSALEKGDGEHLSALRQDGDVTLQTSQRDVRFLQLQQAKESTQVLLRSRATTLERYTYYLSLLGTAPDATTVPATFDVDSDTELTEDNFDDVYQTLVGQYDLTIAPQAYPPLQLAGTSSASAQSGASGTGQLFLNTNEDTELNALLPDGRDTRYDTHSTISMARYLSLLPDLTLNYQPVGCGVSIGAGFGGNKISGFMHDGATVQDILAAYSQDQAGMASRTASYQRRVSDWTLQANLAARELMQFGRQIIGSMIAEQVAEADYESVKQQQDQSETIRTYLQTKFTNEDLYLWTQGQLSTLYYQYYRFALDTARQAEQTMKRELMRPELDATTFVQANYWNSTTRGLLSGEAMHLDVKRMELAYYNSNARELEITRHVSLRQLDPQALIALRATGQCAFTIPEWFFDRECPGHYMRRIKNVGCSLPSVVGPYTTVNCTVTLQSSSVRVSSVLANNQYARQGDADARFVDYYGSAATIVTSGASNDTGMFETNLNDERFLPFEGAGVINSAWQLELPSVFPPFDYTTISDAILHMRYTARQAGDPLASQCTKELVAAFKSGTYSLDLLFLLRNDFPTEWAAFVNSTVATPAFQFTLQKSYFPYAVQGMTLTLTSLQVYAANLSPASPAPDQSNLSAYSAALNGPTASATVSIAADTAALTKSATQVYLVIQYTAAAP
jgi:hypothetical protein